MTDAERRKLGEDRNRSIEEQMKILRENGLDRLAKICEDTARGKAEWNKLIEKAGEKLRTERQEQQQNTTPLKDTIEAVRGRPEPTTNGTQGTQTTYGKIAAPVEDPPPSRERKPSYDDVYRESTDRDTGRKDRGQDQDRDK